MNGTILDLSAARAVIFDGAMGTMLMASGLAAGEVPERLNVDRPGQVMEIHRKYFEAGVDVVHTNTFGGNPIKLGDLGCGDQTALLNREGARIAPGGLPGREVRGRGHRTHRQDDGPPWARSLKSRWKRPFRPRPRPFWRGAQT